MIVTQFTEFQSSTLVSANYDSESKQLKIAFKHAEYEYDEVDFETYLKFITSESHGRALNELIKGKFAFVKIEPVEEKQ